MIGVPLPNTRKAEEDVTKNADAVHEGSDNEDDVADAAADDHHHDHQIHLALFPVQCVPLFQREIRESQECGSWPTSADGLLLSQSQPSDVRTHAQLSLDTADSHLSHT